MLIKIINRKVRNVLRKVLKDTLIFMLNME
jgi:hypothetical protein